MAVVPQRYTADMELTRSQHRYLSGAGAQAFSFMMCTRLPVQILASWMFGNPVHWIS